MKYIIDIDGTICTQTSTHESYEEALPFKERIEKVNELFNNGHTIVYMTARGMATDVDYTDLTVNQLKEWGCLYNEIIMNVKPSYDVWVDDKANWIF